VDITPERAAGDGGWIAVVGQLRKEGARLPVPYVKAVAAAGGIPRVLSTFELLPSEDPPKGVRVLTALDPHDASVLEGATGLLLPGGGDIDPAWYGRPRHPRTHRVSHRRDRFECTLLEAALERDMPVLAICHGMQLLNVFLGGPLHQHLVEQPGVMDHDGEGLPGPDPVHGLRLAEGSLLARVFGTTSLGVNSHHHQGLARVASELQEVAWASDGVLEGVVSRRHSWVVGVQWHPEVMAPVHEPQLALFRAFVDAARAFEAASRADARATA
jgi:gamma-glutamyl-gamma-aminobutyrate hydrolase PuuD